MIDLFKTFLEYVRDKEKPLSRKVIIAIFLLLALLALNEYTGFTYYYPVGKEVEIISNIEVAKTSTNDQEIINYLNEKENDVINRKYLHERFLELFKRDELKKDIVASESNPEIEASSNYSEIISKIFPEMPFRSQFWHTVTSAFIPLVGLAFLVVFLFISPFLKMDEKWASIVACILGIMLAAGMIWLMQFLFGLIPVLFNRAYINYAIPIILQIYYIILILRNNKKKAQRIKL